MATQPDIERALTTQFDTLGYTYVATPNGPLITPPTTSINYALDFIYADATSEGLSIASMIRYTGIFQITVRVPVTNASGDAPGLYDAYTSTDAISALFSRGTAIGYPKASPSMYVHCKSPTIKHVGKVTDEWYIIVVRVPFWSDM